MNTVGSESGGEGADPAVELDGVTKRYGETAAVDDVTLRVREGEFFTLVGPSGCGKTTTLRLIAGFEEPTAGAIRFSGESVAGVPPEDRDVGVVFQNYALFPHMTVGENVGYGLNFADPPKGMSRSERVDELLELVDLPDAADRDPESLSGGQQQRVAMARALAPGPDLLLLDEPMSALDAQLRERLRVQVRRIQSELGITTVYVTHDQEEALAISDRVAVMRDGRPEQIAPPRTVYREPSSRFVAEFVGDNNVFAGRVVDVEGDEVGRELRIAVVDVGGETLRVGVDEGVEVTVGDHLTFCVRPEYLRIDEGESRLTATVASAEFLGETTRVTLDWGGRDLVVRTRDPLSGEVVVGFDPEDAHVIGIGEE
ncbi:spermidine/putrescine ABC transporter ATP-binding protein [Halorubrum saccharovorum]|uniref:Molybdate/tungstate import ATP-binding protein WtpC n=1 Tax=Halorubrum saccharovorum TaxID=2248 RepID=A0A0F8AY83_9EURY|nr:ABC transporter ATP-binding protein [Halorubrum saccharovorum]KKF39690.1 spermidine/putrescine ABC transporter ATP-binding protein [Halorubrum saccharovorum]